MVDVHTTFLQNLFQIAIGDGVSHIEEDRVQDNILRELHTFERHHPPDLIDKSRWQIDHHSKVCDTTPH